MSTSGLAHFCHQAISTFFNVLRVLESWYALGDLGEKNEALRVWMTSAEVPESSVDCVGNMKDGCNGKASTEPII
jgi:hypothetical protein